MSYSTNQQVNKESTKLSTFGTFSVPYLHQNTERGSGSNYSVFPSTYSTLTPSSELFSVQFLSDEDSIGSKPESSDNSAVKVHLLKRQSKSRLETKSTASLPKDKKRTFRLFRLFRYSLLYMTSKLKLSRLFNSDYPANLSLDSICDDKSFQFLSVTHRIPLDFLILLALFYSYIPFIIFLFIFPLGIRISYVFSSYLAVYCGGITFTNELVIKKLLKQPRPKNSLVQSYGMPSSHCMVSYCILVLLILVAYIHPEYHFLSRPDTILLCILLIPTPWGRLHLEDHTLSQCIFGCISGSLCGTIGFLLSEAIIPTQIK